MVATLVRLHIQNSGSWVFIKIITRVRLASLIADWNHLGADDIDQFARVERDYYLAVATVSWSELLHVADHFAHFDVTVVHKTKKR